MTKQSEQPIYPRTPSGFVRADQAHVLRRIADARAAVDASLPVRVFYPTDDAAAGVVTHFEFTNEAGWSVFGDVSRGAHGLVISRMEVRPPVDSTGVTAGLLRKIPVGEILTAVRTKAAWEAAQKAGTRAVLGQEPVLGVFNEGDEKPIRRAGRAPLAPDLLRAVAVGYIEENAPGAAPGAMKRLADRFGKPEETVRNWVTRARRDGWLGPSAKGRAGAEPGPRLVFDQIEESSPWGRKGANVAPFDEADLPDPPDAGSTYEVGPDVDGDTNRGGSPE